MPIVVTAGHVDHGKSTLIKALSGRDPDRWAEEKERGLTIDLGFAWQQIAGYEVGFVDVPGHERFIKNMLAGVGAVDVALFVVAADEGWMPQSEEHLAVLDLLNVDRGVIALTRVDITDADTIDLSELEIMEKVEGTSLAEWPIVRVSAIGGEGMDSLQSALVEQLGAAGDPGDTGRPRLWVDRAFHISGAGMVVTGTLTGGTLTAGEDLTLNPGEIPVRVREMQQHDAPVESLAPGSRAALNISGADSAERGMLLAGPNTVATTKRFLTTLRPVRSLGEELTGRGAYHLHVGSGSWPVRIRLLDESTCLVVSPAPIPAQAGDRFILRETGRRAVVGGGRILDPHPPHPGADLRRAAAALRAVLDTSVDDIADALLELRSTASLTDLDRDSGGGRPSTPFITGSSAMAPAAAADLLADMTSQANRFHRENRLRPGIPKAELASSLEVDSDTVTLVVAGATDLIDDGATIRIAGFEPGLSPAEERAWHEAKAILEESLGVPRASQLGMDAELLHALVRDGRLVRVAPDLVFLPAQIDAIRTALSDIPDEFTVAEFRDLIGVTRRQAVPLLEWMDKQSITRRRGDTRVLLPVTHDDKPTPG